MKKVYKYPIPKEDYSLELPENFKILKIGVQKNSPKMWILVDTDKIKRKQKFIVLPTGIEVPVNTEYIDSFLLKDGELVFHVFKVLEQ